MRPIAQTYLDERAVEEGEAQGRAAGAQAPQHSVPGSLAQLLPAREIVHVTRGHLGHGNVESWGAGAW